MSKKLIDTNIPILPIGAIAQSLNVHQRTLRIWDKAGILSPSRTDKNRRYYSLNDLEKARAILFLTRNLALNLSGVKIILALMKKNKVGVDNYFDFLKKLAHDADISEQTQENNIQKTSRKGRKKDLES